MFIYSRSQGVIDYLMVDLKHGKSIASELGRPQGALATMVRMW